MNTTIRKIGNSEGIIIPKELLDELGLKAGDSVALRRDEDGLRIQSAEADFERQMKIAREAMKKYKVALRELAK